MADAADPKTDEERKDEADTRQERACKGRKYKEMVETGAVTPRKERKVCILSAGWTLIKVDYFLIERYCHGLNLKCLGLYLKCYLTVI